MANPFSLNKQRLIPGTWSWTELQQVVLILDNDRIPVNSDEREARISSKRQSDLFPYYGATGQVGWIDDFLFDDERVLLGEDGAPFLEALREKAYLIRGKSWVNNHAHVLKSIDGLTTNKYVMYYLNIFDYHGYVTGTTRYKLTQARMREIPFPLAPLAEQHRIVAKIEELFTQLDAAEAALKRAKANLERYRRSVLQAAVTGELTKEWRCEHKDCDAWKNTRLNEIGELNRGKSKHRPRNAEFLYGGVYPFIQTGDVKQADGIIREYHQTYSEQGLKQSRLWPAGTLCITIAANIAETAVLGFDSCFPDSIVGFIPNPKVCIVQYVEYFFRTARSNLERYAPATAQKNINLDILSKLEISLPPLNEQKQIVAKVDELFEHVNYTETAVSQSLYQINRLRQSILEEAFHGRLGAQNPEDEPAAALLQRIQAERAANAALPKTQKPKGKK